MDGHPFPNSNPPKNSKKDKIKKKKKLRVVTMKMKNIIIKNNSAIKIKHLIPIINLYSLAPAGNLWDILNLAICSKEFSLTSNNMDSFSLV